MTKQFLNLIFLFSCTAPFYAAETKRKEVQHSVHYLFNLEEYDILLKAVGEHKDQAFYNRHISGGMYGSDTSVKELVAELDNQNGSCAKWRYNEGRLELDITIKNKRIQGIRRGMLSYFICLTKGWQCD